MGGAHSVSLYTCLKDVNRVDTVSIELFLVKFQGLLENGEEELYSFCGKLC